MAKEDSHPKIYTMFLIMCWATAIGILTLIGLLSYWCLYPYEPFKSDPAEYTLIYPENKTVEQGEYITYEFKYTKNTDVIPEIQLQFVDGLIFNVSDIGYTGVIAPGAGTVRVEVYVPKTLPPGKYRLKIISKFQMNPVRTIYYENFTEEFKVIPYEDK